ncbi:MAG TPA: ubiquinol-cytochrome c reductase iron-sulfur subunit [Acetobacteraceae bacterium]|nr:ubiquinol-cytochrome c reductase iron-sulfur subunit [Acetobacteraceae bacterium]
MTAGLVAHPAAAPVPASELPRRDFLALVTFATASIGAAAAGWALIESMNPAADVIAAGGPIDIDLTKLAAGQQIVVRWRGSPILVVKRTPDALRTLRSRSLLARLSDPNSDVPRQPSCARNWHRSINPEFAVLVGACRAISSSAPEPGRMRGRQSRRPKTWPSASR